MLTAPEGKSGSRECRGVDRRRADRGDMVGLDRVPHAEQKPKPQNSEHLSPARRARSKSADNLTSRHREEQTEASNPNDVLPGWWLSTRPGISRFRVRCFASPRNDGTIQAPPPSFQRTSSKRLRIDAHERRAACA